MQMAVVTRGREVGAGAQAIHWRVGNINKIDALAQELAVRGPPCPK